MLFLFLLIGAVLGVALFEIEGLLPGVLLGYLAYRDRNWQQKVDTLNKQIHFLHNRIRSLDTKQEPIEFTVDSEDVEDARSTAEEPVTQEYPPPFPPFEEGEESRKEVLELDPEKVIKDDVPAPETRHADGYAHLTDSEAINKKPETDELEPEPVSVVESVRAFILQLNWPVLSGIAVLFIGLSLAIEYQLFPLEWMLILIAVAGCAMIYIGSRLARRRPQYGFILQGGGIAVLYLTIFASFRLYGFLQEPVATGLLMAITMFGVLLGLAQNAQWVSVISMLGGFLVPVLINNEAGSHVALFSYYAILNMGILGTAWYKPWRYLNLTGFVCTFGVATAWGGLFYEPEYFASIEPFLALFFVIYLSIGVLYTLRHDGSIKHAVDGTLVFGLPVVVFALQASLVEQFEYGISISSAILGICYVGVAHWLRSRKSKKVGLLIESFDGIGIALISLFIPFLFDTMWTGVGWAIEGAALVWLGMRQQRILVRVSGYILAIGASIVFIYGAIEVDGWGYIPLGLSLLFIAYQNYAYRDEVSDIERFMEPVTMYSGLLFWLVGGARELTDWLTYPREIHALVVFSGVTALLCSLVGRRLKWKAFTSASLFNVVSLFILMIISSVDGHPFLYWGGVAWLAAFVATYASLYLAEPHLSNQWLGRSHAVYVWIIAVLGCIEGVWVMEEFSQSDSVWPLWGSMIIPLGLVILVSFVSRQPVWPFGPYKKAYLRLAVFPVLIGVALISIGGSFENNGDGVYAAYLPVLNPLDVLLFGYVFVAMFWYKRVRAEGIDLGPIFQRRVLVWSLVALMFVWLNATIARTVHHWTDVPYNEAMWESSIFQAALSICWTLLAVITMAIVARRGIRTTWMVAACLLAVVILKLFAVDLSSLSAVPRIVSFVGVGVLLILIGYIAPAPPKRVPGSGPG